MLILLPLAIIGAAAVILYGLILADVLHQDYLARKRKKG